MSRAGAWIVGLAALVWLGGFPGTARSEEPARGVVFEDRNGDGRRDAGEPGLADVGVSNGRDVVKTDREGRYELPAIEGQAVFVIKPRDFMTPVSAQQLPRFYYLHQPAGSPAKLRYAGVAPTGPLPASIDFPLTKRPEPEQFDVLVFGDPQPRDLTEVTYLARDVVERVDPRGVAFGVSLGDIVYDRLTLFEPYAAVVGTLGLPWYNVPGNHDHNYDGDGDEQGNESWKRVFGPPTYAFNHGPVHFIVVDDVQLRGPAEPGKYDGAFGRHLVFLENDLRHVPRDRLVVLLMHIPVVEARDKERLFALLKDRPHTFSLSAHWHYQQHFFLTEQDGWPGRTPHHHLVHPTACGSWWSGGRDECGIPHTLSRDGAPNGWSVITFRGTGYSVRFVPARRPADEQMAIYLPESVPAAEAGRTELLVNVYAGSERSTVEWRIGGGAWAALERTARVDPNYAAVRKAEAERKPPPGHQLGEPAICPHLWAARLPAGLAPGVHVVEVRTTDLFQQTATARRILRVE